MAPTGMRLLGPTTIAAIALALASAGCGGTGTTAREIGQEAGAAASRAREYAGAGGRLRRIACRNVETKQYAAALQGERADRATGVC